MRTVVLLLLASCVIHDEPAGEDTDCVSVTRWRDFDRDGFGDTEITSEGCESPAGFVDVSGDCDDSDDTVFPGATEVCDRRDTNCDGTSDAEVQTLFMDADADGFGDPETATEICAPGSGLIAQGADCDDTNAAVFPGAVETCDGIDDDCDGHVDNGVLQTWHADADGDGFGDPASVEAACVPPASWVLDATDCAPDDPDAHPGAEDACGDGFDADCRGGDAGCPYEGEHSLDEAPITLTSTEGGMGSGSKVRVGDVTNDGIGDLVISTYRGVWPGGAYVVPGPIVEDRVLDARAIHISGTSPALGAGASIGAGDLDGDGITDLALGAPNVPEGNGLYVLTGPVTRDRELGTDADIVLLGPVDSWAGISADVADVNGDGFDDGIVGAPGAYDRSGAVYVAYGPLAPGEHDLAETADVTLVGEESSESYFQAGSSVCGGGDLNGDGVGDMLVASPGASFGAASTGAVWVVYGPADAYASLADADGRILGDKARFVGGEIGMGDLDGDGLTDIGVSSYTSAHVSYTSAHVVFGPAGGERHVDDAEVIVNGLPEFGPPVFHIGDYNGDGLGELVLGVPRDSTNALWAGGVYFFYALSDGVYDRTDADALFLGEIVSGYAGTGITTGDVDGDEDHELLVGAPGWSEVTGGEVYVLD